MSQIVNVKTDIKNFKSLEKAATNLGYTIEKLGAEKFRLSGSASLECTKEGDTYTFRGDSDYMGRGKSGGLIVELRNEYAKEEALAWAKFTGRTVLKVSGNAKKGYDVEISE